MTSEDALGTGSGPPHNVRCKDAVQPWNACLCTHVSTHTRLHRCLHILTAPYNLSMHVCTPMCTTMYAHFYRGICTHALCTRIHFRDTHVCVCRYERMLWTDVHTCTRARAHVYTHARMRARAHTSHTRVHTQTYRHTHRHIISARLYTNMSVQMSVYAHV